MAADTEEGPQVFEVPLQVSKREVKLVEGLVGEQDPEHMGEGFQGSMEEV